MACDLAVAKFGGSILRSGRGFTELAETVAGLLEEHDGVVVVVSAMKGVTDELLEVIEARGGWEEKLKGIMERYYSAAKEALTGSQLHRALSELSMLFDELLKLVWASKVVGDITPYTIASIASFGEKLSAALASHVLRSRGMGSVWLDAGRAGLIASGDPLQATVDYEASAKLVEERVAGIACDGVVPVVTGFMASTRDGRTVLLGRGGSDYTATLLARFTGARRVYLYTDVDGMYTADPRIVPEARHIPLLSLDEATELALLGAKRMHPRTFEPLHGSRVEVVVTRPGAARSTRIVEDAEGPPVKAVAAAGGVAVVAIEGAGMAGRVGVASKVMAAAASLNASIRVIAQPASETRIAVVVEEGKAEALAGLVEGQLASLGVKAEVKPAALLTLVGYGLKSPDIASEAMAKGLRASNALGAVWAPGSPSISFIVKPSKLEDAVRRLHREVVEPWWTG